MLADESGVKLEPPRGAWTDAPESAPGGDRAREGGGSGQGYIPKIELLKVNAMAVDFYYRQTRSFPRAIDYFLGRGLTRETIREFRLGYAPPGWSDLLAFAKNRGISQASLVGCGLAIEKPDGKAYDRFRDRIMFPIFDTSRRPIGFGGRGMTPDAQPKYLNSPETLLYQKNKTLYGLHAAQHHIKEAKSLIVVEGYMDFLSLYQAGVRNVIATSGTALTDTQARIIQRFSPTVYLVFDGDGAGINAAKRAISVLAPCNLDVRVLILTEAKDPDEYVKKFGGDAFLSLLEKSSVGFMHFIIERTISEKGIDSPQKKSAALDALVPLAQSIPDSIIRMEFVKLIGESLRLSEGVILSRFKNDPKAPDARVGKGNADFAGTLEGQCLRLLLSEPSLIREACTYIAPETFTDRFSGELFSSIVNCFEKDPGLLSLMDSIADPEKKRVISLLIAQGSYEGDCREDLRHTILRLQRKFLKNRRHGYQERMKNELNNRMNLLKLVGEDATQQKEIETPS
jgi:DNA primase